MSSKDTGHPEDQVQSFLWDTTQQGDTFVPGTVSEQSRTTRDNAVIQAIDQQFPHVAQQQVRDPEVQESPRNRTSADLSGVGQQFHGYTQY